MIVKKIELRNFRNYKDIKLSLEQGINILYGKNAQGKTNLLEAILYLSTTQSHRTNDDLNLIKENEEFFCIKSEVEDMNKKFCIAATISKKGKNLSLYNNPIKKVSEFIGLINAVIFCPDDLNLFSSSPRIRRRFIDIELSKLSREYIKALNCYVKLLKNRNICLKSKKVDLVLIDTITKQMIDYEILILRERNKFLKRNVEIAQNYYKTLSNDEAKLDYKYISNIEYSSDDDILKANLINAYEKTKERDLMTFQTNTGIHKDDFVIMLDDHEIGSFGSQGQKRSVIISMKLGIIDMIKEKINEYPILLLDDVFSELDINRRKKLLELLPDKIQTLITTTEIEEFIEIKKDINYLEVKNGCVNNIKGGY
ncbi:MAG: DNA replication/repair protein RecF [Erysipelotrichaceae bacterium]